LSTLFLFFCDSFSFEPAPFLPRKKYITTAPPLCQQKLSKISK